MMKNGSNNHHSIFSHICDNLLFFMHFVKHPVRVAAPLPSTRGATDLVRKELVSAGVRRVVELGPGLGSLTAGILEALGPDEKPLCIEMDPLFCRRLRRRFGDRIEIVQGNALEAPQIVKGTVWEKPDAIVSSVPLINRSAHPLCETIADMLSPHGLYLQVANFYGAVENYFDIKKTYHIMANFPPEHLHIAFPKNGNSSGVDRPSGLS